MMQIRCKKCGNEFAPDLRVRECWPCASCPAKNPNLKRHYRSVADLCVLGLIGTAISVAVGYSMNGVTLGTIIAVVHAALLLTTVIVIYRAEMPWENLVAKRMIWIVFGLALVWNVLLPVALGAWPQSIPFMVIYSLIFPYLFWLRNQTQKCSVAGAAPPPLSGLTQQARSSGM